MDKFKLTILKKMIHNKEPLSASQIDEFAEHFMDVWSKNNHNSTPSKLPVKFYNSLDPRSAEDSQVVFTFKHYMNYHG